MSKGKPIPPKAGMKNLIPIRDTETAKARGKLGGIKSGIVKRENKRMSEMYADFLATEHDVTIDDIQKKLSGEKLLQETIKRVMVRSDSSSVSLMKEIREATEGQNVNLNGDMEITTIKRVIVDKEKP